MAMEFCACLCPAQDAHRDEGGSRAARRKRKFGPMDAKHTVTSVVFLHQDHVVASAGERAPDETPLRSPFPAQGSLTSC